MKIPVLTLTALGALLASAAPLRDANKTITVSTADLQASDQIEEVVQSHLPDSKAALEAEVSTSKPCHGRSMTYFAEKPSGWLKCEQCYTWGSNKPEGRVTCHPIPYDEVLNERAIPAKDEASEQSKPLHTTAPLPPPKDPFEIFKRSTPLEKDPDLVNTTTFNTTLNNTSPLYPRTTNPNPKLPTPVPPFHLSPLIPQDNQYGLYTHPSTGNPYFARLYTQGHLSPLPYTSIPDGAYIYNYGHKTTSTPQTTLSTTIDTTSSTSTSSTSESIQSDPWSAHCFREQCFPCMTCGDWMLQHFGDSVDGKCERRDGEGMCISWSGGEGGKRKTEGMFTAYAFGGVKELCKDGWSRECWRPHGEKE